MLELDSVVKLFGTTVAISGVELSVREHEYLVILGPAGAGKSTTLRLISGLTKPTRGDIRIDGRSLLGVAPEHRDVSMVFENYALYPQRTVFENLSFPLEARRVPRSEIKRRVESMASILLIDSLLDRRPGELSGGQRQRVALGRGLIRDATVYLLDEPLSHLDARIRQDVRVQLKAMSVDLHSMVIHVTQDYREAMSLADRMAVLNEGRIQQVGTPDEIYAAPVNEFVAMFVGDPPMSLLDATFVHENGRPVLKVAGTNISLPADELVGRVKNGATPPALRVAARPTDVPVSATETKECYIPAQVYVSESHGYRNIVTIKLGDATIRVAAPPKKIWRVNDPIWLGLGMYNLHAFANGKAIYHPAVSAAGETTRPQRSFTAASTTGN
jgi:multiple sugar transport system ATP-binding protein